MDTDTFPAAKVAIAVSRRGPRRAYAKGATERRLRAATPTHRVHGLLGGVVVNAELMASHSVFAAGDAAVFHGGGSGCRGESTTRCTRVRCCLNDRVPRARFDSGEASSSATAASAAGGPIRLPQERGIGHLDRGSIAGGGH